MRFQCISCFRRFPMHLTVYHRFQRFPCFTRFKCSPFFLMRQASASYCHSQCNGRPIVPAHAARFYMLPWDLKSLLSNSHARSHQFIETSQDTRFPYTRPPPSSLCHRDLIPVSQLVTVPVMASTSPYPYFPPSHLFPSASSHPPPSPSPSPSPSSQPSPSPHSTPPPSSSYSQFSPHPPSLY
jgi:hypothetical protein